MNVNKDLQYERNRCTFRTIELTNLLDGGADRTLERRELEEYFLSDPELHDVVPDKFKSHKEIYEEAVRKSCLVLQKVRLLQESGKGGMNVYTHIIGARLGTAIFNDGFPFLVHFAMFLPGIMGQGNTKQQAYWMTKSWNGDIIGTYAQTELGHGTFIRGLETTATYDPQTKEFVLNSPTLTSYKWWPGGLGHTANHAIVLAQLYTEGDCKGIHPFIVQLRDTNTHEPLPGIKIGEIGTKLGMNAVNNGFLGFENVRIPRESMMMKNSQVLEDGTYVKSKNDKLTYGTMVFVRVMLLNDIITYLAKACTIATRYSAVRRQGQIHSDKPEVQILDYVTQQYKIFPHIAAYFAFKMVAIHMWDLYNSVNSQLEQGDMDKLPELHALSCCLKAVASADGANGVEQLRLACGGHGYMDASNLPVTYGLITAICTYEGENTVMLLQTARYLVRGWKQAVAGEPLPSTVQYLEPIAKGIRPRSWKNTLDCFINAFHTVAAGSIRLATENMDQRIRNGVSPEDAWNQTSIQLTQCAEAHCRAFIVKTFIESVRRVSSMSAELRKVLYQLCELYAVHWLLQKRGDFYQFYNMTKEDVLLLQSRLEELLVAIRPNAVGIVDSFDYRDDILNSALGVYDGNVYERLYAEALKSPLNQESVNQSFVKYLKPYLKCNL
ncbi:probable peroxisomal acyl-coenzyme A oxidase 1 [Ceratina calcarata]|uniref:Acyl-coenzyme A oxidase n=1 Tax=Ceratina calcarata TaxID=156304 RepID=A0AAJ7ND96_9HYME|nr:probable peroxisomal acyl-coenzyme A oxidase 1 [Ceratina calcarata]